MIMKRLVLLMVIFLPVTAGAEIFYVHAEKGRKGATGSAEDPLRSVREAVVRARPGDTILLVPGQGIIKESININNRSGAVESPITLDGGGNWLTGAETIDPTEWVEVKPGLYRNSILIPRLAGADPAARKPLMGRFFLIINGVSERMGRFSKGNGNKAPWRNPAELEPGQWTYDEKDGSLYFRTTSGTPMADYHLEAPVRQNGLAIRGECNHWMIRNLNVTHVWNDGFNFHGKTKDIRLENVSAVECGDDGMSAHEQCEIAVDGFIARDNSTGICHINESVSHNTRIRLEGNHGVNLYLLGSGHHEFTSSQISVRGAGIHFKSPVTVRMSDCVFDWPESLDAGKEKSWRQEAGTKVEGLKASGGFGNTTVK